MAGDDTTKPANGLNGGREGGEIPGADAEAGGFADQETGQLKLGDEDASLPWLEGDDDEEYYEGYNTGRLIGIALLGLLVLVAVAGGIWWLTHRMGAGAPVADGSIVHAPEQPYKEQPKDPGGSVMAGTGDSSFVVAEGQTRQMRLGEAAPVTTATGDKLVKIARDDAKKDAAAANDAVAATSEAAAPPGVGVQVGAYSTRTSAEAGWKTLSQQYEALSGLHYRIVEGQADIGTVYRLQAVSGDLAGAQALCRRLRADGLNCQVKR